MAAYSVMDKASRVRWLVLDVDGVLTNGQLTYDAQGEALKTFDVRDGFGLKLLRTAGLNLAVITGRTSAMVERRMQDLGITEVQQGREDKGAALLALASRLNIPLDEIAYMGDDWPDLSALALCGLSLAPADADPEVRKRVDFITQRSGGCGAVREAAELILLAQGCLDELLQGYLQLPTQDLMT